MVAYREKILKLLLLKTELEFQLYRPFISTKMQTIFGKCNVTLNYIK
jgi:hypothetical protein